MDNGNIPTPIFNRKRPRQAILAHPNNSQGTGLTQNSGNFMHNGQARGRAQQFLGPQNAAFGRGQNPPTATRGVHTSRPPGPPSQPGFGRTNGRGHIPSTKSIANQRPMPQKQNPYSNWNNPAGQQANVPRNMAQLHPQLPYNSPAKGNQPWGTPSVPNTSGSFDTNTKMISTATCFEDDFNEQTCMDGAMYPTSYQPTNQSPYPPKKSQPKKPPPPTTSQPGKNSSDKFKIKTKFSGHEQNSARLLAATVNRVKQWMKHKDKIPLLFEIIGKIQPFNVGTLTESSEVLFTLQDDTDTIQAVFFEIDRSFPRTNNGQNYRMVGLSDQKQTRLHCLSIRPANTAELQLHLSAVNASDASMNHWAAINEH